MSWQDTFDALAARAVHRAGESAVVTLGLAAEDSDFVRFNHGRVRQAGSVRQGYLDVRWVVGRRHATETITLSGVPGEDLGRLDAAIDELAAVVPSLPEDPHLLLDTSGARSERVGADHTPAGREVVETVVGLAQGLDLVGVWQSGGVHRAFASSHGHRHWFTHHGFSLDWSLVHDADRAVKRTWAGTAWDPAALGAAIGEARGQLAALARPPRTIPPGRYRAWLTPTAAAEIVSLLSYDSFGVRAQRTRASCLGKLVDGELSLDPRISLSENIADGSAPAFQGDGFLRPDRVPLIAEGRHAGCLISPRSAVEYGLQTNGADGGEVPVALDLAPGDLPTSDVLQRLGTGVYVSNLWYTNHSDRNAARVTGMTRFATFWVEDGELVAPLSVMRFDDSIYALLGERLEALGSEAAFLPELGTYGGRSTGSQRLPGLLLSGFTFTL